MTNHDCLAGIGRVKPGDEGIVCVIVNDAKSALGDRNIEVRALVLIVGDENSSPTHWCAARQDGIDLSWPR